MNTKYQTKQRILWRLAFSFAIALLLCLATTAQELDPNPNPVGHTITIPGGTSVLNNWLFRNWGTIDNSGMIDNHSMIVNWSIIDNDGVIDSFDYINNWDYIGNTGTINNRVSGTIENNGIIDNSDTIDNWGHILNNVSIDNTGTITNFESGHIYNLGGTIDNTGNIQNNGVWYNTGTFTNQGIFEGTGSFEGTLDASSGTIAPGGSAGTMYVIGDFILDGSGILDIEIGGFDAGEYDLLDITGTAFLPGGNINFSFLPGYDIITDVGPGESWELSFLHAGTIDSFSSAITYDSMSVPYFQYNVFQRDNDLIFQATNTVPLPGAFLLGSLGLSFAALKLRRHRAI